MKEDNQMLEQEMLKFVDEVKDLLSPQLWNSILLDCTKNEVLILWLLYRQEEANMSQLAEYIHVPLNTATGIVTRMERRELILRSRSVEDKRIVTVRLGDQGRKQMQQLMTEFGYYAAKMAMSFTGEEMELLGRMMQKVMKVMKDKKEQEQKSSKSTIKKISIL
ncbi:MAG TPA: MarR family transcriptional regulator [Lachnospiraceae bacterium]|nr:MarR family transcriptional regulator [Lachnospiraceae bacterium]